MNLQILEKNAVLLHTPYCDLTLTDEYNNKFAFDILETPQKNVLVYTDNNENNAVPVTSCDGKTMRIYTSSLLIRKNYYIHTSVKLERRDSDERLFTDGITGDTYTFAVSFPDPNDDIKFYKYTDDELKKYDIENQGEKYLLRLFDRENEYIDIFTFWIWNIQHHMSDYESACDVATWWCP